MDRKIIRLSFDQGLVMQLLVAGYSGKCLFVFCSSVVFVSDNVVGFLGFKR